MKLGDIPAPEEKAKERGRGIRLGLVQVVVDESRLIDVILDEDVGEAVLGDEARLFRWPGFRTVAPVILRPIFGSKLAGRGPCDECTIGVFFDAG